MCKMFGGKDVLRMLYCRVQSTELMKHKYLFFSFRKESGVSGDEGVGLVGVVFKTVENKD